MKPAQILPELLPETLYLQLTEFKHMHNAADSNKVGIIDTRCLLVREPNNFPGCYKTIYRAISAGYKASMTSRQLASMVAARRMAQTPTWTPRITPCTTTAPSLTATK